MGSEAKRELASETLLAAFRCTCTATTRQQSNVRALLAFMWSEGGRHRGAVFYLAFIMQKLSWERRIIIFGKRIS